MVITCNLFNLIRKKTYKRKKRKGSISLCNLINRCVQIKLC